MNELIQQHEGKKLMREAGYIETNRRAAASYDCEAMQIYVYENASGPEGERYKLGRDAYDECMNEKGL